MWELTYQDKIATSPCLTASCEPSQGQAWSVPSLVTHSWEKECRSEQEEPGGSVSVIWVSLGQSETDHSVSRGSWVLDGVPGKKNPSFWGAGTKD